MLHFLVPVVLGVAPVGGPLPRVELDRSAPLGTSIFETVAPSELRGHGSESFSVGIEGFSASLVGQAGETVAGGPAGYALWEVTISGAVIGTGFPERFYFAEPIPRPTTPAPLLVVHHRFGKTHLDLAVGTDYTAQATARGWYVAAMLAASNKHFVSIEAQRNLEFVLEWLVNALPTIDTQRIYGVGFSMGGGMALNYAARHLDPTRPMFAALVDHTGDVSLSHVFEHEVLSAQQILAFWYGTVKPLSVDPVALQRSSVIDFDPATGQFRQDRDMMRNLTNTPLMLTRASNDTVIVNGVPYLKVQTDALDRHIRNVLGIPIGPTYQYQIYPYSGHSWDMLPEQTVLDFFEPFTLALPSSGRVLADRNARWYWFTTTLLDPGQNGEFDWNVDGPGNVLTLSKGINLSALAIDSLAAGLDTTQPLTISIQTDDLQGVDLFVRDFAAAPSQVLLDGAPAGSFVLESLVVLPAVPDGQTHVWQVVP